MRIDHALVEQVLNLKTAGISEHDRRNLVSVYAGLSAFAGESADIDARLVKIERRLRALLTPGSAAGPMG